MVELFCMMCGHRWFDPHVDACPECKCRDFIVNDVPGVPDEKEVEDWGDGHYEGDFPYPVSNNNDIGD